MDETSFSFQNLYKKNHFGDIFENTVFAFRPHVCVELGVLDGYSSVHIGLGLREVHRFFNHKGHLYAYDNSDVQESKAEIDHIKLSEYITIEMADPFEIYKRFGNNSVCLLHVNLCNDGDIVNRIIEDWHPLVGFNGIMMIEGGSEERDSIEWMMKNRKAGIKRAIEKNPILNGCYVYGTYSKFPSMTVAIKKLGDPNENKQR